MLHPWLAPPPALIADVVAATAREAVRAMSLIPVRGLARYAEAWTRLVAALPELLRSDSGAVFDAVSRVDVLSTVQELVDRDVNEARLERAGPRRVRTAGGRGGARPGRRRRGRTARSPARRGGGAGRAGGRRGPRVGASRCGRRPATPPEWFGRRR